MKVILFLILNIFLYGAHAQIEVGYHMDSEGKPIEGYLDTYEYRNDKAINMNVVSNEYEKGYYYSHSGNRIDGYIKFRSQHLYFKRSLSSTSLEKITPIEAQSFVISQDSFYVSENVNYNWLGQPTHKLKHFFVQHFASFDSMEYAVHYHFKGTVITRTYLHRKLGQHVWVNSPVYSSNTSTVGVFNISNKKNGLKFENYIKSYFGNTKLYKYCPEDKKFDTSDIPSLIKSAQYESKFRKNEKLYFDQWWNEVEKTSEYTYTGEIVSIDEKYTIRYYQEGQVLNESQYASIGPNIRQGHSKSYYPDGSLRKQAMYDKNELTSLRTYFKNGSPHYQIIVDNDKSFIYNKVMSKDGERYLDDLGNGKEELLDEINGRTVYREFENFKMIKSFYKEHGKFIYQLTYPYFSIGPLDKFWKSKYSDYRFYHALEDNATGYMMTLVRVSDERTVKNNDYQQLAEIHPEVDSTFAHFLEAKMGTEAKYPAKFMTLKDDDGKKVSYEFVLPFRFTIQRFFLEQSKYFYHDPMWMHQQMMMNNQLQNIQVTLPAGF